jgi:hypothetical protein
VTTNEQDNQVDYELALLQFRPVVSSEERINIGVVLYSPTTSEVASRLSDRYGRLTALFPRLDGSSYRTMVRHLQSRLREVAGPNRDGRQRRLTIGVTNIDSLLNHVIRSPSANFSWSTIRYGVCEDLELRKEELFEEYVSQFETARQRERVDDKVLWESVKQTAAFQEIAPELDDSITISTTDYTYTFRAGWMNGVRQVVEPISLDYVKPADMVEEANKWRGRLEELKRTNEFLMTAIITEPPANGARHKYDQATSILRRASQIRGVFTRSQVPDFASLVKADIEGH